MIVPEATSVNQKLESTLLKEHGIDISVKREDQIHQHISGNKWRKLRYNIQAACERGHKTILTFGGAYSNHIAATAAAGKEFGFKTIGIIRGEEYSTLNPTLQFAAEQGMHLSYVSRDEYRHKNDQHFNHELRKKFGEFYLVPEGGANVEGVKGCTEILTDQDRAFDYICCACGTGTTLAGLILSATKGQKVLGFPAIKGGEYLQDEILKLTGETGTDWDLINDYHFGGYAKVNTELIEFLRSFKRDTGVQLDPIYTGKMLHGILDMIRKGYFKKGASILAIHTGGLQGIKGLEERLGNTILLL